MRRTAVIASATVLVMLLGGSVAIPEEAESPEGLSPAGYAEFLSTDPDRDLIDELIRGPFAGVLDHLDGLVAGLFQVADLGDVRTDAAAHVTIVTTGLDSAALGDDAARATVYPSGVAPEGGPASDGRDAVGWGTWATSVVLQAAPAATADVIDVYPDTLPDERALAEVLAGIDPSATDAVLLAFPPADVLDPTLRMLATGRSGDVFDAALNTISTRSDGSKVVGIPLDPEAQKNAEYIGGWADKRDVRAAAAAMRSWESSVDAIGAIVAAGVPVVAPAGDLGPSPQTVLGLAGLTDVITVGVTDVDGQVAPTSARGPSVHGTAKPDVATPVVFAGVLPATSALTSLLDVNGLVDAALPVVLDGSVGSRRTASTSTVSSAATIAAAVAALHVGGIDDVGLVRGALMAAASPTADRDVLAQGAGVVSTFPRLADLARRPVVSGPIDLGMEPDSPTAAPWSATVSTRGGSAESSKTTFTHWVGTGADGRRHAEVLAAEPRPVVNTRIDGPDPRGYGPVGSYDDGELTVWLLPGENEWKPGVFCGYSRVTLIGTSNDVDSPVIGTGTVRVPEDVPTCLVEGMRLDVLNFYIHDVPAQDFTLALLPNLPVGMDVIEGPTMVLPVHPTKERLYSKISGPDGYATFGAVVPGFYRMRQFSDYAVDVDEYHPGGVISRDLGNPLTYSSKDALVLPDSVCAVKRQDRGGTPDPCHVDLLDDIDAAGGDGEVGYDKTTGRYLVEMPGIGEQGVILGWAKKMQLTVVASRYIDVMRGIDWTTDSPQRTVREVADLVSDLSQIDAFGELSRPLAEAADALIDEAGNEAAALAGLTDLWAWDAPSGEGDPLRATYRGLVLDGNPTSVLGMADYPFTLTTPNYKGSIDWNFTYGLADAALIAIVRIGGERHVALFTPAGVVSLSPITTEQPIDPVGMLTVAAANGVAHLKFVTHPRGAPEGMLTLLAVPLDTFEPASVDLAHMSMEMTTWQRVEWPPTKHQRNGATITGHEFELQPRYNLDQMQGICRDVPGALTGGFDGAVCEEWNVMTHSGRYDVETFRIKDPVTGQDVTGEVAPAGGRFYDPEHGVTDATLTLAHDLPLDAAIAGDVNIRRELRSNGEFFEMLHLPTAVIAAHPDRLVIQLADNIVGRQATTITTHEVGAVPLRGYLRFSSQHHPVVGPVDDLRDELIVEADEGLQDVRDLEGPTVPALPSPEVPELPSPTLPDVPEAPSMQPVAWQLPARYDGADHAPWACTLAV